MDWKNTTECYSNHRAHIGPRLQRSPAPDKDRFHGEAKGYLIQYPH